MCCKVKSTGLKMIRDALCNLVSFAQFNKDEKHPWRSITFSKVAGLSNTLKVILK